MGKAWSKTSIEVDVGGGGGGGVARCVCMNIHQSRNETENHTRPCVHLLQKINDSFVQ